MGAKLLTTNIDTNSGIYNKYYKKYIYPVIDKQKIPDEIIHYTDIGGFVGIIDNKELWASHTHFLNDKTEIKYTLNLSKKIFETLCKEKGLNEEEKNKHLDVFDTIKKKLEDINEVNYFSLSFSINPDSNLLWSNYSKNDGYNIAFNTSRLIKQLDKKQESNEEQSNDEPEQVLLCSRIFYDRVEQERILTELLTEIFDLLTRQDNLGDIHIEDSEDFLDAIKTLRWFSIFFKDACFAQEEEFRIAFFYNDNYEGYHCRPSSGTFIPYIIKKFDIDQKIVAGVTIGPKNNMDINLDGLRKFIKLKRIDLSPDQINVSRIPYRY